MKNIAIIGSTGSIGTQTLDVIREHREDFCVSALACGKNVSLLAAQIREFHPALVSVADEETAGKLKDLIPEAQCDVMTGMEGLIAVSTIPESDILVTAVVGMLGIRPTIAAIEAGKDIAIANKETLVSAGHIIMPLAKKCGVQILPVDSEHSAIFQSLQGNTGNRIDRILLTASGGAFRGKSLDELRTVTPAQALNNPNWDMGKKVTIDSATMVNKGLEVMEAHWLFDVDVDDITVLVHPQSVLHSAVQYEDGAVIGELGVPDMRIPIQYALYYPHRPHLSGRRLNLFELQRLTFEEPDLSVFRGLALAREVGKRGGNLPTAFNAADETAVDLFLKGEIAFTEIPDLLAKAVDECEFIENPTVEQIFETREKALKL